MGTSSLNKLEAADAQSSLNEDGSRPSSGVEREARSPTQWDGRNDGGWGDSHQAGVPSNPESQAETDDETRALLNSIAQGDRSAFWELWQRHQKYLFGVCCRQMGGVRADAEDALSRSMLK